MEKKQKKKQRVLFVTDLSTVRDHKIVCFVFLFIKNLNLFLLNKYTYNYKKVYERKNV